jgi:hypothetical protein
LLELIISYLAFSFICYGGLSMINDLLPCVYSQYEEKQKITAKLYMSFLWPAMPIVWVAILIDSIFDTDDKYFTKILNYMIK